MGDARRRKLAQISDVRNGRVPIKIPPRQRAQGFPFVHYKRAEQQQGDTVYAVNYFQPVNEHGLMFEETPDGPQPVLVASLPQPIRKSVLVRA